MKASDFSKVRVLMKELSDIENDIANCAGSLGVTIVGRYQDDAMVEAVRSHVVAELQRRATALQEQLKKLGVSFERTGIFG